MKNILNFLPRFVCVLSLFFSLSAYSEENGATTKMKNIDCEVNSVAKEWLGKNLDQAMGEFGSPSAEDTFDLNNSVINEFRGKLRLLFPDTESEKWIKEVSWRISDCVLTLWLEKQQENWVVVDFLYWNKDTEF